MDPAILDTIRTVLAVAAGGLSAVLGSIIAENKRTKREREAWRRTHEAERVLRINERRRATIEELQDLVHRFFANIESAATFAIQRSASAWETEYMRERQSECLTAQDRATVLVDRLPDRIHATLIRDYFRAPWFLAMRTAPAAVLEGDSSIGAHRVLVAETLRDAWLDLEGERLLPDGTETGRGDESPGF